MPQSFNEKCPEVSTNGKSVPWNGMNIWTYLLSFVFILVINCFKASILSADDHFGFYWVIKFSIRFSFSSLFFLFQNLFFSFLFFFFFGLGVIFTQGERWLWVDLYIKKIATLDRDVTGWIKYWVAVVVVGATTITTTTAIIIIIFITCELIIHLNVQPLIEHLMKDISGWTFVRFWSWTPYPKVANQRIWSWMLPWAIRISNVTDYSFRLATLNENQVINNNIPHISMFVSNIPCWLIDFNGMSTRLRLFYTESSGNHVWCISIFTFFMLLLLKVFFFAQLFDIKYSYPTDIMCTQMNGLKYSYLILIICTQLYGLKYSYLILIICTQLYGLKYSYLILIICTQLYGLKYSYLILIICTQLYGLKYSYLILIICTQLYGLKYSYLILIICTQLYGLKYSYLILIICTQLYGLKYSYLILIICTQLYGLKYSYLILIICTQLYGLKYSYLILIICTQLYGLKYSYLILIICTQLYGLKYSYLILIICTQLYGLKYSYLILIICTQF